MGVVVLGIGINGLAVIRSQGSRGLVIGRGYNDATEEIGIHSNYLTASYEFSVKSREPSLYKWLVDILKARSFAFFSIKDLKSFFISIKQLITVKPSRLKRI